MQALFRMQQFAVGRLIFSDNSCYSSSSIRLKTVKWESVFEGPINLIYSAL